MAEQAAIDLALLVLRVGIGIVFVAHGYNHFFGGGRLSGTARWFESLGMRPGRLHAWVASLAELGGGILLIVGFLTPLAAAAVVGTMSVALVTNHRKNGFFIFRPGEGYEYVLTLVLMGLAISGLGAGAWSVDGLLNLFQPPGWWGLGIAVVGGLGGGAALLALFWRPVKQPAAG
ncbi:DoxX family protein [Granulicoccus phenolivorans]|uniref:DoxX family protein n=1 Tax=Granulicoccus phenolivorans TaxID=266854 RepID=UPI0004136C38|nr:DoxX family protein [Granulicoccus phenolivorans]